MSNALSEWVKANCAKAERGPLAPLFLTGRGVIVEEKIKGRRVFLWHSNAKLVMATKHNGIYGPETEVKGVKVYRQLFEELRADSVAPASIFDCELWPERGEGEPTLYVFDILFHENEDVRSKTLSERKALLRTAITESAHVKVLPWSTCKGVQDVAAAKAEIVGRGGEGVVVKADTRYAATGSWLKDKAEETIDCYVSDFGKGEKGETTYFMSVNDGGSVLVLGEVYSAVKDVDRSEIRLGSVLECRFQVHAGELVFPGTILRVRDDKTPEECKRDQW